MHAGLHGYADLAPVQLHAIASSTTRDSYMNAAHLFLEASTNLLEASNERVSFTGGADGSHK